MTGSTGALAADSARRVLRRIPGAGAPRGLRSDSATARQPRSSPARARSTGYVCRASTPGPASPRSSASPSTVAGCSPRPGSQASRTRVPRRDPRARHDVPRRRGRGTRHRLHAAARRRPHLIRLVRGVRGRVRLRSELVDPLRLRLDRAVGPQGRSRAHRHRRARTPSTSSGEVPFHGEDFRTISDFEVDEGQTMAFVADVAPVARQATEGHRCCAPSSRDRATVACVVVPVHVRGRVQRRRPAFARSRSRRSPTRRPAGSSPHRPRRCPSSSAASETGTTASAGCATRRSRSSRAGPERIHRRGARVARMASARRRRRSRRRCRSSTRSTASGGAEEVEVPWLPGYEGARPVRVGNAAVGAAAARRLRRGDGRALPVPPTRARDRARRVGRPLVLLEYLESSLGRARRGHLGGSRPSQQFTHSKVMAWVAFDRAVRRLEEHGRGRPDRAVARPARSRSTSEVCATGFDRGAGLLRAALRIEGARRQPADDPDGGLSAGERPARRRDRARDRAEPRRRRRVSSAATETESRIDGLPAGEGRVPAVQLLARRQLRPRWAGTTEARRLFERLRRAAQRRRAALRGVRRASRPPGRQLPAGLHPRLAREQRAQRAQRPASAPARLRRSAVAPATTWRFGREVGTARGPKTARSSTGASLAPGAAHGYAPALSALVRHGLPRLSGRGGGWASSRIPVSMMLWVRTPYVTKQDDPVEQPVAVRSPPPRARRRRRLPVLPLRGRALEVRRRAADGGLHELPQPGLAGVRSDSRRCARAGSSGEPIRWRRVHQLPQFVYFDHSAHLSHGVGCAECHGRVDLMGQVHAVAPLTMQWCLDCHTDPAPHLRPKSEVDQYGMGARPASPRESARPSPATSTSTRR